MQRLLRIQPALSDFRYQRRKTGKPGYTLIPSPSVVAVPAFQHSPMFGHIDSSQTVLKRCLLDSYCVFRNNRTLTAFWRAATLACHRALRAHCCSVGCFWPFLTAEKPASVRNFCPLVVLVHLEHQAHFGQQEYRGIIYRRCSSTRHKVWSATWIVHAFKGHALSHKSEIKKFPAGGRENQGENQ